LAGRASNQVPAFDAALSQFKTTLRFHQLQDHYLGR